MDLSSVFSVAGSSFKYAEKFMNPIIIFAVIILGGVILGGIVNSALRRIFLELKFDDRMSSVFKAKRNYSRATRHTIVRGIYFVAIVMALQYAGILLYAVYALLVLVAILLLIKLFEKMVVFIPSVKAVSSIKTKASIGEEITVLTPNGVINGSLENIGIFNCRMRGENGDAMLIPNVTFLKSRIVKRK